MTQRGSIKPPIARAMSLEEWADMPEDEPGELVDGQLIEEEVADTPHEVIVSWFVQVLNNWARPRKGVVLGSEAKYALHEGRGRKPDLSVFFTRDRKLPRKGAITIPPDLIVEVVSPTPRDGRRDRVEKLREYAKFGLRWYWIVDPRLRSLEILRLGDDGHYTNVVSAADGAIEVPSCEGLVIDLDALWSEVDEVVEGPDEPEDR
ncbi:MAG: Uma2 family endonuclease [Byssovorax sp.]